MEFEKPVIGTIEPAPANLPILLNRFKPVKNALIPIRIIDPKGVKAVLYNRRIRGFLINIVLILFICLYFFHKISSFHELS